MKSKVAILTTGGTIDKIYSPKTGGLLVDVPTVMLVLGQAGVPRTSVRELMRKDSLDMSDEDRASIVAAVASLAAERVLITHGTDTMVETAARIAAAGIEKTVVLTGAMVPYRSAGSDAAFNVGCAFQAASLLPHGVYIVMHGRVFNHDRVCKNTSSNRFEAR